MRLVEQHVIAHCDSCFALIDQAAFQSKNLYNAALYMVRQAFIREGKYLTYTKLDKLMQQHEAYRALPRKVSQWVLKGLHHNWLSFFESLKVYEEDPSKFTGRPKLPKYKHKIDGRNLPVYTLQAISKPELGQGIIKPSQLAITVKTKQQSIKQVRIVPKNGYYVVEVVYERVPVQAPVDPGFCVGIDLGVTNLAAIASNRVGFAPRLVNGRPLKACNQWYNKRLRQLRKLLPKEDRERVTRQMQRITNRRNRQIDHYLHTASRRIIDFLVEEGVGTVVIGLNPLWKQEARLGKRTNQNFVSIPHSRFIDMLTYKAALVGILVEIREESYTSKASFLDLDPIPEYKTDAQEGHHFSGKRIGPRSRLYRAKGGKVISADVNGAYNICAKVDPMHLQRE